MIRLLIILAATSVVYAYPPTQYQMVAIVAGKEIKGQPTTWDRCEAQVKAQPNLRAVCVPIIK